MHQKQIIKNTTKQCEQGIQVSSMSQCMIQYYAVEDEEKADCLKEILFNESLPK